MAVATITTASISGTVLTVSSGSAVISIGMVLTGTNVLAGTIIISYGTGSGNMGTYNVNYSQKQ